MEKGSGGGEKGDLREIVMKAKCIGSMKGIGP